MLARIQTIFQQLCYQRPSKHRSSYQYTGVRKGAWKQIQKSGLSNCTNRCKNYYIFYKKNLLFLFYTTTFTKHPHQIIYSTNLFNKIFILLHFFIISFNLLSLSLPITFPSILIHSLSSYLQNLYLTVTETQFVPPKKKNRSPTTISCHHPRHFYKCKSKKDDQFTTQHHINNPENSKKKKKKFIETP